MTRFLYGLRIIAWLVGLHLLAFCLMFIPYRAVIAYADMTELCRQTQGCVSVYAHFRYSQDRLAHWAIVVNRSKLADARIASEQAARDWAHQYQMDRLGMRRFYYQPLDVTLKVVDETPAPAAPMTSKKKKGRA